MDIEESSEIEVSQIEKEFSQVEDQIKELQKLVRKYEGEAVLAKEKGDPETLSNCLIRLARINSSLGNKASFAKYIARNADRAYRRERENKKLDYIRQGMAIGKAESLAYVNTGNTFKVYSEVQLLADTSDDLAYKTDTFMKMAQSGLSLIKKDIHG